MDLRLLLSFCAAVAGAPLHYSSSSSGQVPADCPIKYSLQVRISGGDAGSLSGRTVTIHLKESSLDFLHSSERTGGGGGVAGSDGRQFRASALPPCFYQGFVEGDDGLAFAKQRNGFISGNFHFSNRVYEIPEQPAPSAAPSSPPPPLTARLHPPLSGSRNCGVRTDKKPDPVPAPEEREEIHRRSRRSLMLDKRTGNSELSKKYIQLVLVGDKTFYSSQGSSMSRAQDRLWEIGNYVNALYKQLGVNVVTVYTETWTSDPYTLTSTGPDEVSANELLTQFLIYRMRRLGAKTHSTAHLVSGLKFAGRGEVGLASMGRLCSFSQAGGVNSDRTPNVYSIAATVAHELGHNLGLNHDEEEKVAICGTCPDSQGCVMATVGSSVDPVRFSNCSLFRFLDFTRASGLGYCMTDPPPSSATVGAKATCGNRIVETGEDCDCGPPGEWCNNTCCNPNTCKFTAGAACASGECCNINTCTLMAQGTVCRAERSTCDLPEFCNGASEWCPQFDDYKVDGTECLAGKAYCYKGRCNDRDSRCSAIFSETGGYSAGPAEWAVATTKGNSRGYCSYNETSLNPLRYSYTACTAANQRCGLLYCQGGTLASGVPVPEWKGISETSVFDAYMGGVSINSAGFIKHNLKYSGYRDPGLVPNGAECGTNMMCVDSVCVSTTSSVTCPNCNGRGSCAQSGLCFCQAGYRPPDCLQTGGGGSLTNPLPAHGGSGGSGGSVTDRGSSKSKGSSRSVGGCPNAFGRILGCLLVIIVLK